MSDPPFGPAGEKARSVWSARSLLPLSQVAGQKGGSKLAALQTLRALRHETPAHSARSAGVQECWLVLGPEKPIEVHHQPQGGQFAEHALHGPGGTLTSAAVPGFTVGWGRRLAA